MPVWLGERMCGRGSISTGQSGEWASALCGRSRSTRRESICLSKGEGPAVEQVGRWRLCGESSGIARQDLSERQVQRVIVLMLEAQAIKGKR